MPASLRGGSLDHDAAARRRWPGLRHRPGQPGGQRLRRFGQGRFAHRRSTCLGGRIPNGATVERAVANGFTAEPFVILNLHTPDFTTSARLTEGINKLFGDGTAQSVDGVSVKVAAPADAEPAHRLSGHARGHRDRAGRCAGACDRQFAHRHRGHRLARAGDARGRGARFAVGHHHRARLGEPAQ